VRDQGDLLVRSRRVAAQAVRRGGGGGDNLEWLSRRDILTAEVALLEGLQRSIGDFMIVPPSVQIFALTLSRGGFTLKLTGLVSPGEAAPE